MLINYFAGFTVRFYYCKRRPYWNDRRRPYWRFQWCIHEKEGRNFIIVNSHLVNTFRLSTLRKKCQSSHFHFGDAQVVTQSNMAAVGLSFPRIDTRSSPIFQNIGGASRSAREAKRKKGRGRDKKRKNMLMVL